MSHAPRGVYETLCRRRARRARPSTRRTSFDTPGEKSTRYKSVRHLGEGTFGTATLARDADDGSLAVVKRIACETLDEANDGLVEVAALAAVSSAYVLHLRDHFLDFSEGVLSVCIVTPYAEGGDLAGRIAHARAEGVRFPEAVIVTWAHQALEGLAALHARGMLHRDVKPANLLLRSAGAIDDDCGGLLIGDLGVAAFTPVAATMAGSPYYMAPEVNAGERYDGRADVYSLGMSLQEAAALRRSRRRLERFDGLYSEAFVHWLSTLLERNPARRPSAGAAAVGLDAHCPRI